MVGIPLILHALTQWERLIFINIIKVMKISALYGDYMLIYFGTFLFDHQSKKAR